jgi:hypothetical protein
VYFEASLSTSDEQLQSRAVRAALEVLNDTFNTDMPATTISTRVHRRAYAVLKNRDPYAETKKLSNTTALKLLPLAKSYVANSEDPFKSAVITAIIGNTFDFGVQGFKVPLESFDKSFKTLTARGLAIDHTEEIKKLASGRVVYIADNCGEILFDTLLFEQIHTLGGHITLVVRGEPILNDATMDDVIQLEIDKCVDRVLTTGSNAVGVCIEEAPGELIKALENADIIISKGMANYETLSEYPYKPIAYLLRAKCEPVAQSIGATKGDLVAKLYK